MIVPPSAAADSEEFTSHKRIKALRGTVEVRSGDQIPQDVLGTQVSVSGEEVKRFIRSYERRLAEYLDAPLMDMMPGGTLTKRTPGLKCYVLGAAICKHYGFPSKRFIEAQFYYYDEWKCQAPPLSYVVSLQSSWNAVGRYKQYCDSFSDELDYFSPGEDNVTRACRLGVRIVAPQAISGQLGGIYEEMITFQIEAGGVTRKEALKLLGKPGNNYIPVRYLRSLPEYIELVSEDAWGPSSYEFDFYRKLRVEIENMINAG